jgi:hypothetical protein
MKLSYAMIGGLGILPGDRKRIVFWKGRDYPCG